MERAVPFEVGSVLDEFRGAELGDVRLERRLSRVVDRLAADPTRSFPDAMVTGAELEGSYRLIENPSVDAASVHAPHQEASWARAKSVKCVLSLEDTTEMRFGGASTRDGMGDLAGGGHGFFLHVGMLAALDSDGQRAIPIGVPAYEIVVRPPGKQKRSKEAASAAADKETLRWNRMMERVDTEATARGVTVVHVADREASQYDLMAEVCERKGHFVIRIQAGFGTKSVRGAISAAELERSVAVSAKPPVRGKRERHVRRERTARLRVTGCGFTIAKPRKGRHPIPLGEVNLVEVREIDPPEGEDPIEWTLVTTEPISTPDDLSKVLDSYRARWLIEEYFKALKTGCSMEARQMESLHAMENTLTMFIPMAWHMLLLRAVVRDAPATPASLLVTAGQYALLVHLAQPANNRWGIRFGPGATATELLYAIARMGGHIRNNGAPGWITIARGLHRLYEIEAVALALGGLTCDQS
jgi:hypothetical protein